MSKRIVLLFFVLIVLSVMAQVGVYAAEGAFTQTVKVQFNGGSRDVKAVWVDMKDPLYRAEVALAKGQIGQVDDLENIVLQLEDQETDVVAAINGTFFNAYSDMQPAGSLQMKGKNIYVNNQGASIGFSGGNDVEFSHIYTSIAGSVNDIWEWPYNWGVWGINQVYNSADANVLYTPEFGKEVDAGTKTAIIVRNKKVVKIQKGLSPIYSDGYTLVFGADVYIKMFKVGDKVDYRVQFNQVDFSDGIKKGGPLEWTNIRTTVGAGPLLLNDGKIVLDAAREGFTDPKFVNRAQRSFIGETADRILVFGTVENVTLTELAEIMLNLDIEDGMNLDGGASSGLYYEGNVITKPGRKLSNALVITRKETRPVRLQLNGRELFLDTDPYFENNTTMVPMRGIVEALGAEAGWDSATGTLWALKDGIKVEMWNNSNTVRVNGVERELLAPVRVVYNRTHVPARFMTEIFGGEIEFDRERYMVVMNMP